MTSFTASEIAEITGVKECVIRYWEEYVPSICPQRDDAGRKLYSQNDMKKFLRLRHLVYVDKYTIEGAAARIQQEVNGTSQAPQKNQDVNTEKLSEDFSYINDELLKVYSLMRQHADDRK
ncbi:MAG: MerR family transcriptional regulator [Treponemataceae bacterium]|nr:MerR family transcriptional regulator [Treponemataceae bacterium]